MVSQFRSVFSAYTLTSAIASSKLEAALVGATNMLITVASAMMSERMRLYMFSFLLLIVDCVKKETHRF